MYINYLKFTWLAIFENCALIHALLGKSIVLPWNFKKASPFDRAFTFFKSEGKALTKYNEKQGDIKQSINQSINNFINVSKVK